MSKSSGGAGRSSTRSFALFVILGFLVTTGIGISAIRLTIDRAVWQFQSSMLSDEADVFASAIRKIIIFERNALHMQTIGIDPKGIDAKVPAIRETFDMIAIFDEDSRLLFSGPAFGSANLNAARRLIEQEGLSKNGEGKQSVLLAKGSTPGTVLLAVRQDLSDGRGGYAVASRPSPDSLFAAAGYLTLLHNRAETQRDTLQQLRVAGDDALIQRSLNIANTDLVMELPLQTLQAQRNAILGAVSLAVFLGLAGAFALIFGLGRRLILSPIAALRKSQWQLKQSEQQARRLAAALEETEDHIFISNEEGEMIWVNRAACLGTEYGRNELIGRKANDLLSGPETSESVREIVIDARANRRSTKFRSLNYKKSGETYIADVSITPIVHEDTADVTFIAIERNATETHLAEERLRNAVEALNDGFAIADLDGRFLIANAAYRNRIAQLGVIIHVGDTYQDMVQALADAGLADIGAGEPDEWVSDSIRKFDAGHSRDFLATDRNGNAILRCHRRLPSGETVMMATDVTQLAEARRTAESAVEAKSRLTASISHELRTPLSGVISVAALLLEQDLTPETRESVELIKHSGEALLMIINDILDVSKLEQGRMTLRPEPFDILKVAEDVCALLAQAAYAKGLFLTLRFEPQMCHHLIGDKGRVQQVLTNLIGNAIKFTDTGGVALRLSSGTTGGRCFLSAEVSDTGVGIADADLESIFVPFAQSKNLRAAKAQEGTGLGLSICRELARLMDGTLTARSEIGLGSTFTFTGVLCCDHGGHEVQRVDPEAVRRLSADDVKVVIAASASATGALMDQVSFLCDGEVEAVSAEDNAIASRDIKIIEYPEFFEESLFGFDADGTIILICKPKVVISEKLAARQARGDLIILRQPLRTSTLRGALEQAVGIAPPVQIASEDTGQPKAALSSPVFPAPVSVRNAAAPDLPLVIAVEDNATNQFIISAMLSGLPLRLAICSRAAEALTLVALERPDIVLMDIHLPDMTGPEATRALHAIQKQAKTDLTPVYGYSAGLSDAERLECDSAGMVDIVEKPTKKPDLLRVIGAHVPLAAAEPR